MTHRNEQEYQWLIGSSGMKVLQEELGFEEIFVPLMDIHANNPDLSKKLHQICDRLVFVERLKHGSTFKLGFNESRISQYQLDRLVLYMSLTCIDAAAGREYKSFESWLRKELKLESPRASVSEMLDNLLVCEDHSKLKKALSTWVCKLHAKEYLETDKEGIGRKFRSFLSTDLPEWVQAWLANVYVIVEGDRLPRRTSEWKWFDRNINSRCQAIAKHLFELRNKYTHTVNYLPSMEYNDLYARGMTIEHYNFSRFQRDDEIHSPTVKHVGVRSGSSESDIVRFLLVVQLRRWVGINSDPKIAQTYFDRAEYRRCGFEFLNELDMNFQIIQKWGLEVLDLYHDAPVSELYTESAIKFLHLHDRLSFSQNSSSVWLTSYIQEIGSVNNIINASINGRENEIANNREFLLQKRELLDKLIKADEIRRAISKITHIQRDIFERLNQSYY